MKITVDIPSFAKNRVIHVLAGIERIAYIDPKDRKLRVKVSRCSQCGKCCQKMKCEQLEKEPGNNDFWRCGKAIGYGLMRPYLCCVSEPKNIPECTSKYEPVD